MELIDGVNLLEFFSNEKLNGQLVFQTFNALWNIVRRVHSLKYVHGRICFKNFYYLNSSSEFRLVGFKNVRPIKKPRDERIDYWSFGVCIYTVLCGHSPFSLQERNANTVIENDDFDQLSEQWSDLNMDIKSFINQLLCNSIPTCSSGELKKIVNASVRGVQYSEAQIEENEQIVAIRAAKLQNHQAIETKSTSGQNGLIKVTNGNSAAVETHDVVKSLATKMEKISEFTESHSNSNEINGHVETAPLKRRRKKKAAEDEPIENGYNKRRKEDSDALIPAKILGPEEIKVERRSSRKKAVVNYAQKQNPRSRIGKAAAKLASENQVQLHKIKVERKSPKISTQDTKPRQRGRPRKLQPNEPEPPVQINQKPNKAPTIQEKHSVPNKPKTQSKKKIKGDVDNTVSSRPKPKTTDQAVQTDFVFMWPLRPPTPPPKYYTFVRFDYDK